MDTNNKGKTLLEVLDNIELGLLKKDTGYAMQFLQEEGFNLETESNFATQHLKKITFMTQAVSNKAQDESLLAIAVVKIREAIQENMGKTTEMLVAILKSKTPSVQYRKLENWTDEEIKNVLEDVDIVQLMEELDKKKQ
jgi:hypothetical protein